MNGYRGKPWGLRPRLEMFRTLGASEKPCEFMLTQNPKFRRLTQAPYKQLRNLGLTHMRVAQGSLDRPATEGQPSRRLRSCCQQVCLAECAGSTADLVEGKAGANGDIEQIMLAVRKVQNPEHGHLPGSGIFDSTHLAIQSAPAKLGLAFRIAIKIIIVFLEDLDDSQQLVERFSE